MLEIKRVFEVGLIHADKYKKLCFVFCAVANLSLYFFSDLVIRGLALGTLNDQTRNQFLTREFRMAVALSGILSVAGFCRAIFFKTPFLETVAVTSALTLIVFSSVCLGAILPLLLEWVGIDPAHSSTSIQGTLRIV
jgi:Mg/Co/Ni transporter MgtE